VQDPKTFALYVTASFLLGALSSGIAGYVGMWVSIRSNIRVAAAAMTSLNDALQTALRGGAVSGLFTVAMSLLGVGGLFAALTSFAPAGMDAGEWAQHIPFLIVGYGFGASFVALFAQLGGGIYTKAADVGADLVGKVEAGIPEDDPRNPAVIADLVGDNVGDCAGRGADLFESTAAENIGAMILGVLLYRSFGINGILFPLVIMALGLICSIVGVMVVRTKEDADPMKALNFGYYVTAALVTVAFFFATRILLNPAGFPERVVALLPVRTDRHRDVDRVRVHHAVLHRVSLPARARHRRGEPDRSGHEHHRGHRRRHGVHGAAGDHDRHRDHLELRARPDERARERCW
jgi:K(+)-stimulated pyrophosphate-energized sodium pump